MVVKKTKKTIERKKVFEEVQNKNFLYPWHKARTDCIGYAVDSVEGPHYWVTGSLTLSNGSNVLEWYFSSDITNRSEEEATSDLDAINTLIDNLSEFREKFSSAVESARAARKVTSTD